MQITKLCPWLVAAAVLSGCAQIPPDAGSNPEDPYEGFNRHMFYFNDQLDRKLLKPVTTGYRWAVPGMVREHVSNVFETMAEPNTTVNSFLQGKPREGFNSAFRFILNATLGIAGIFDVADWVGIPKTHEDFGQTLAVWGVGEGPYLMLPFLGPSGGRDIFSIPVEFGTNPLTYALWDEKWYWGTGTSALIAVDLRSQMMDSGIEDMRGNVLDEYAAVRNAYRQQRRSEVADGNISEEETLGSLTPLNFDEEDEE